jgi:hypothetical protein
MKRNKLNDHANSLIVQKHQLNAAESQITSLDSTLNAISIEQDNNEELLNQLINQAESIITDSEIVFEVEEEDAFLIEKSLKIHSDEIEMTHQKLNTIDYIDINDSTNWNEYLDKIESYATRNNVNFGNDPFHELMSVSQRIALEKRIKEDFSHKSANCDKYDYMIAGTCGLIGGLIDVFFVGLPNQSKLTKWTDSLTDTAVQKFAKFNGWDGAKEAKDPTASAIGFLELKAWYKKGSLDVDAVDDYLDEELRRLLKNS